MKSKKLEKSLFTEIDNAEATTINGGYKAVIEDPQPIISRSGNSVGVPPLIIF